MLRALRRFTQLGGQERRLFASAWIVLAATRLALWVAPSPWLVRRVLARSTRPSPRPAEVEAATIGTAVNRAARFVPRATCLPQALATLWLMAGRGQTGCLRIGVKKGEGGTLLAHAWVEHEGRIVVGNFGVKQYTVMPSLEGVLFLR
jgi:hypothetical protein